MKDHPCCASDPAVKEELEQCLMKELEEVPDEESLDKYGEALHALSHPIRLKMAFLLLKREHCTCELIQQTQKPPNLISHHLGVMRKSGIVKAIMKSKWKYYMLNPSAEAILKGIQEI